MYLARLSYSRLLLAALGSQRESINKKPEDQRSNKGSEEAAKISLSSLDFTNRLERHLSDYNSGKGYLSNSIGLEVLDKQDNTSTALSESSPRELARYSGYVSGFGYSQRARFVKGVDEMASSLKNFKV